tara:strand:+ start:80 stop:553 length:474 start_codon:yes stop_codon:yes gene_type:complete
LASKRIERAKAKGSLATELALTGAAVGSLVGPVGGVIGGSVGGLTGLIVGDQETVFPMDMIAIPAFQAYLLSSQPSFSIFIKEGEVLTQVIQTDAMEAIEVLDEVSTPAKRRRAPGAGLPKKYAKLGFKKGWAAYKKTPAYKNKQARKKASKKRGKR